MKWLFLLFVLLLPIYAAAEIGTVTELNGTATIKRNKDTIAVSKGTAIEMNDKVETKNGKVKITFKDSTVVSVTEHSSLVIDDFVYDPKNNSGKLNLKAASGTVRYVSGAIAHNNPQAVNIKTPTASIAVRGTDFIMSVNEIGSSMVILMPSCDLESPDINEPVCKSGKIEVESGLTTVTLDTAFQATIVESIGNAPSMPVVVNLYNTPLGNNLQFSPPKTPGGANLTAAAKSSSPEVKEKDDNQEQEKQSSAANKDDSKSKKSNKEDEKTVLELAAGPVANQVAAVGDTENPNVKTLWKDKSETQQIGWLYQSLSENSQNYTNIILPMGTHVQVIVTQDYVTNSYNFSSTGKSQGSITINQTRK